MDCRAFRKRHLAFVDDTLPGVDVRRMREHLERCAVCSTWDHRVRRSLMVARSHLHTIEPSADFGERLAQRLAAERRAATWRPAIPPPMGRWGSVIVVAGVLAVVGATATMWRSNPPSSRVVRLPAVVMTPPRNAAEASLPYATPAFMASMSTGMAIFPALMLAEEVPLRLSASDDAGTTLRTAGLTYPTEPR
ncbi:MAG: zf-HC2 domain-containing protein [Gemmatimonadaceae bacterium]|nr:zf-HC2 domain-containing protein [Gemmatimonadaceae bacterium]